MGMKIKQSELLIISTTYSELALLSLSSRTAFPIIIFCSYFPPLKTGNVKSQNDQFEKPSAKSFKLVVTRQVFIFLSFSAISQPLSPTCCYKSVANFQIFKLVNFEESYRERNLTFSRV